ncbi:MAG TPA: PAS domain S-box protein [Burkholderiales bacterium]|nr:PAS domain S-box protein [Burkholderiales bacterium]
MKLPHPASGPLIALLFLGNGSALAAFSPPARLVVVTDEAYPPYLFRTDAGTLQGIVLDKWELWSKNTGIPVTVEGMEWVKAQESVRNGAADVVDVIARTEARARIYEFSAPYADVDARIFFNQSITGINDVASMRGFVIGAKDGSACAAWLEERGIKTLRRFPTSDAVVEAARIRDVPLFCMDLTAAQYYIFKLNLADQFRQTEPLYVARFHWAVAKGRTELRDFIQRGFERVSASELRDIENRWIGTPVRPPLDRHYLVYSAGALAAILAGAALLVAWNRALSLRVSARTAELRSALGSVQMHEQRFGQMFRLSPDATVVTSITDGKVIEANEAFCHLTGRARNDVIGRTTEEIGFWRDAAERTARLGPALSAGGLHQYERTIRTPAGVQKDVLVRATRLKMQGEVMLLVLVQDITEQRLAVRLLEESERRLAKMIEASPEAITIAGLEDGVFVEVNPAAERLGGYTRAEMIGRSAQDMGFWPDPEEPRRLVEDVRRDEAVHGREIRLRLKGGGMIYVLASAAMIDLDGRKLMLFQAMDITERKNAEKALREHDELLRELSAHHELVREGERAHIAREIHDEMGQELTALKMDLSVMGLESGADSPRIKEQVRELKARVDDLIQTVRDVATSLRPAALDLGILSGVEWLVEEFRKRSGIACRVKVESEDIDLAEDRSIVVFRILQESLTNISRHADARNVEISLRSDATHVRLDVKDDGRGFDAAAVRQKNTFGLLGIRERAIMLHGTLDITSEPGRGTQVSLSIPIRGQ